MFRVLVARGGTTKRIVFRTCSQRCEQQEVGVVCSKECRCAVQGTLPQCRSALPEYTLLHILGRKPQKSYMSGALAIPGRVYELTAEWRDGPIVDVDFSDGALPGYFGDADEEAVWSITNLCV